MFSAQKMFQVLARTDIYMWCCLQVVCIIGHFEKCFKVGFVFRFKKGL